MWFLLAIAIILGVVAAVAPMDATIRKLTVAAAVICFVVWLLMLLGVFPFYHTTTLRY